MNIRTVDLSLNDGESIAFVGDLHSDSTTPASRKDNFLDTVCRKMENILHSCLKREVKAVFFLGDIFNRVQVTNECIKKTGRQFNRFSENGIFVGSIVGNHDIVRNQTDKLDKSPLSVLYEFGVLEYLNVLNRVVINGKTLITPVSFLEDPVVANPKATYNIMMAHRFYEASDLIASEDDNLTEDYINSLGYDAVVLGHDHIDYPIKEVGNTSILRSGAVMRGTAHNYNFEREVGFYILSDPSNYNKNNWQLVKIDVEPMEDVVSSAVLNKRQNLANLNHMIADLVGELTSSKVGESSILEQVRNDKDLPEVLRAMLLDYFKEAGIIY